MCVCVYQTFICLSTCHRSVYLAVSLLGFLAACLFVCLFVRVFVCSCVRLFVCVCCLQVCLLAWLIAYVLICLHVFIHPTFSSLSTKFANNDGRFENNDEFGGASSLFGILRCFGEIMCRGWQNLSLILRRGLQILRRFWQILRRFWPGILFVSGKALVVLDKSWALQRPGFTPKRSGNRPYI